MDAASRLVVIGCGNLNRNDDGLGVVLARRLKQWLSEDPFENVEVFDAGTGGMDVMFQARGATSLIVVDASLSGAQPGSIFKLPGEEVTDRPEPGFSLHDFRWNHALYAGRRIFADSFPRDVTVYLVEAGDVSLGFDLSPEVSRSVDLVVDEIKNQVREHSSRPSNLSDCRSSADHPAAERMRERPQPQIEIRRGSIYVEASVYSCYFDGLEAIALLRKDEKLLLLPVRHAAAGGLLLKVRNPQGDRVVHAQEFLRNQGIDEGKEWTLPVQWDSRSAALTADWPSNP